MRVAEACSWRFQEGRAVDSEVKLEHALQIEMTMCNGRDPADDLVREDFGLLGPGVLDMDCIPCHERAYAGDTSSLRGNRQVLVPFTR